MEREIAETIYCSISNSKRVDWVELLSKNPNIPVSFLENLLQGYRYTNPAVLTEVLIGLKNGLTTEDVSIYGNPSFDEKQMREIRLGLESLKDKTLVLSYADNKYSSIMMQTARTLLEAGFEVEKVKIYLEAGNHSYARLKEIELGIMHSLSLKQISYYAKPEYSADQMHILRSALESGLDFKEIHIFAKAQFEPNQMKKICDAFIIDKLPINMISIASRVCFDVPQMHEIFDGIKLGLTKEQVEIYTDPSFSTHKMRLIKNLLKMFPKEELIINNIVSANLSYEKMLLLETAIENEVDLSAFQFISSNIANDYSKLNIYMQAILDGISLEEIKKITPYDTKVLPSIISGLKCGITSEEIENASKMNLIIEDFIDAEIAKKLRTLLFNY